VTSAGMTLALFFGKNTLALMRNNGHFVVLRHRIRKDDADFLVRREAGGGGGIRGGGTGERVRGRG
jgi:hypothetical protein